jgi:hypothetical protein
MSSRVRTFVIVHIDVQAEGLQRLQLLYEHGHILENGCMYSKVVVFAFDRELLQCHHGCGPDGLHLLEPVGLQGMVYQVRGIDLELYKIWKFFQDGSEQVGACTVEQEIELNVGSLRPIVW